MARRSLRDLLRKKRVGKKELSPEMRTLLDSFEAQYGTPRGPSEGARSSDNDQSNSARR